MFNLFILCSCGEAISYVTLRGFGNSASIVFLRAPNFCGVEAPNVCMAICYHGFGLPPSVWQSLVELCGQK